MPRNKKHKPVGISHLLAAVFDEKKWRTKLDLHRAFEFWDKTVGSQIATVAQPSLIRSTVLWVKVKDSIWMQQLHLQKILLLEKLNSHLHEAQLTDIHFQLDSSLSPEPAPEEPRKKPVLLDRNKEQEFDRLLGSLENDDLKSSLKNLWVTMQTRKG